MQSKLFFIFTLTLVLGLFSISDVFAEANTKCGSGTYFDTESNSCVSGTPPTNVNSNESDSKNHIIIVLPNAGSSECADNDTCLSPSTIYINIGDTVSFDNQAINQNHWGFVLGKPEQFGTFDLLPLGPSPFEESGVFHYTTLVRPWVVGKIVVGIDGAPEQNYEESKSKAEQIKQEIEQAEESKNLEHANNYIEELTLRMQKLFDIIADLEFQVEKLEIENKNLEKQITEKKISELDKKPIAGFVDKEKNPQIYVDRYNTESSYKEWFDENYPDYASIYEAVGKRQPIPNWIKNNAIWWSEGTLTEDDFVNGIEYLVKKGIIQVD